MEELVYSTPCVDDDDDDDHGCYVDEEDWNAECNENAAYIDRRWMWAAVMAEMVEAVKARKARRPRVFLDRRGRSLHLNLDDYRDNDKQ